MRKVKKVKKSPRLVRVNKANEEVFEGIHPDLKPKSTDTIYFSSEPKFLEQPTDINREWLLGRAFNWYNHFYDRKEAKDFLVDYLEYLGKKAEAKQLRKVPEKEVTTTTGWLARTALRGYKFVEKHEKLMNDELTRLLNAASDEPNTDEDDDKPVAIRKNVQEVMRERTTEVGGEIEGMFDDYLAKGAKSTFNLKVVDHLTKRNILPQHINMLIDPWTRAKAEFVEVLAGEDDQLVEAYSRFTKTQIKNIIKFIEQIITDLHSYVSLKKVARAPRAKKAVPVEKKVAKLQFLKSYKDEKEKLDLVSLSPVKLYGASEAWVYDTAKRKLHHYVADEYTKVLSVKGNTVVGFDAKESGIKTLRKPAEQIKEIMGSKPAARKYFNDIKSVQIKPTGRFNKNLIILKAF